MESLSTTTCSLCVPGKSTSVSPGFAALRASLIYSKDQLVPTSYVL